MLPDLGCVSGQGGECNPKPQSWHLALPPRGCAWSPARCPARESPLTFMSETGGKHRLVGRCLMVATLDSTATFSVVRDGLQAGTISSGLSAG